MRRSLRFPVSLIAAAVGVAMLTGSAPPLRSAPVQADAEKKVSKDGPQAGNVEKRLAEVEKASRALSQRLKALEGTRADLEKRLKASESARAALEKKIAEAEKNRPLLNTRISRLETSGSSLEKRLEASEQARQGLATRLKALHAAQLGLLKKLSDGSTKERQQLAARIEAAKAAGARKFDALARSLSGLQEQLARESAAREAAREEDRKKVAGLQKKSKRLAKRIAKAEGSDEGRTQRAAGVHEDLQRVKREILYLGPSGAVAAKASPKDRPYQDHYPFLGIVHEYLDGSHSEKAGLSEEEAIRIRRIALRSPAHDSELYRGDLIVRADGEPVRSSNLMRPRPIVSRWEKREAMPTYVTEHLPGDVVELEYVRSGVKGTVRLRLTCQTCGDDCVFYNARGNE